MARYSNFRPYLICRNPFHDGERFGCKVGANLSKGTTGANCNNFVFITFDSYQPLVNFLFQRDFQLIFFQNGLVNRFSFLFLILLGLLLGVCGTSALGKGASSPPNDFLIDFQLPFGFFNAFSVFCNSWGKSFSSASVRVIAHLFVSASISAGNRCSNL